jgi:hypothetical protein
MAPLVSCTGISRPGTRRWSSLNPAESSRRLASTDKPDVIYTNVKLPPGIEPEPDPEEDG